MAETPMRGEEVKTERIIAAGTDVVVQTTPLLRVIGGRGKYRHDRGSRREERAHPRGPAPEDVGFSPCRALRLA